MAILGGMNSELAHGQGLESRSRRQFIQGTGAAAALWGIKGQEFSPPAGAEAKRRLKLSCAAYSFRDHLSTPTRDGAMSIGDFVDLCSQWGLDGCELTSYYFHRTDAEFLHGLRRRAFRQGLEVSGTAVGNNFCLPKGAEREAQLKSVRDWVDRAGAMGAPVIRIFAGFGQRGQSRADAFELVVDGIRRSCDYAGSKGITLAIENHGILTERGDDILRILKAVDHEWLGVNLDTGNFHDFPYDNMEKVAPFAVNVQVKAELRTDDGKERRPVDLKRVVKILRSADYRGYLALEYEGNGDPHQAVPALLQELRAASRE